MARSNRSLAKRCRQFGAIALVALLAGCSSKPFEALSSINPFSGGEEDESQRGKIGFVRGFLGGVASDEPRASLIGRDILSSGGTAADVAVAVSLALSVTLPSSAAMGGGGMCVVHDFRSKRTETLDFRPGRAAHPAAPGASPTAVPGLVRGLAVLHARYGRLAWARLVSPAENLARFGTRISRSFGRELGRLPPALAPLFASPKGGGLVKEGEVFKQLDLSSVLGRLRARGAGDFYAGRLARDLVAAVDASGGGLTLADLKAYVPRWAPTLRVRLIQNLDFHFPALGSPPGVISAQLAAALLAHGDWQDTTPELRAHVFAEISSRIYGARGEWVRRDGTLARPPAVLMTEKVIERLADNIDDDRHIPFRSAAGLPLDMSQNALATSFVAADREGNAVACALTMNGLFGSGRHVRGMGIILARAPGAFGHGSDSLAATLLIDRIASTFHYGAAASGGASAPAALMAVTAHAAAGEVTSSLDPAIRVGRVLGVGNPDLTYVEESVNAGTVDALRKRGHRLQSVPGIGLVNAIFCPAGVPSKQVLSCAIRSDPRGFGLATGTE